MVMEWLDTLKIVSGILGSHPRAPQRNFRGSGLISWASWTRRAVNWLAVTAGSSVLAMMRSAVNGYSCSHIFANDLQFANLA